MLSKLLGTITSAGEAKTSKDYWVDDSKCKACYECDTAFSVFVRRHHCRVCGRIFCADCTSHFIPPPRDSADQNWLRVCNFCHRVRQRSARKAVAPLGTAAPDQTIAVLQPEAASTASDAAVEADGDCVSAVSSERLQAVAQGLLDKAAASSSKPRQASAARQTGHDGALTWEVPAALEESFGAVNAAAADGAEQWMFIAAGSNSSRQHALVAMHSEELSAVAQQQLDALVLQLLRAEEVAGVETWKPIVARLAKEAARSLSPMAAAACGQQDPRAYVKVKRLSDMGQPHESVVVQGVACKKNVAHRRMRSQVASPRVLLLGGALEYQRVANKLSSFDTLLEQEREHLRLAVSRIASFKPDVLLVERSVARSAQEELLARGISLVLNVKPELMERLARSLGTKVVPAIEELSAAAMASCGQFRVEVLPPVASPASASPGTGDTGSSATGTSVSTASNGRGGAASGVQLQRTLMFFDGCPRPLGCTVLLKGAPPAELTKVKRVVKFVSFAAYHLVLENAFLAEELALATAATLTSASMASEDPDVLRALARSSIRASADAAAHTRRRGIALALSPHVAVHDPSYVTGDSGTDAQGAARRAEALAGAASAAAAELATTADGVGTGEAYEAASTAAALDAAAAKAGTRAVAAAAAGLAQLQLGEAEGMMSASNSSSPMAAPLSPQYTDPLRRTAREEAVADDADSAATAASVSPVVAGAEAARQLPQAQPWLEGLALYDRQRIFLSMGCRNPRKQLLCEPPSIKRIDFYCHSDLSLSGFISAAAPHQYKKCQTPGCTEGVTAHVRTFLHGSSRITLSIASLPSSEALPGEDKGATWMWLRPKGMGPEVCKAVRRLPLSPESCCLSFGTFLQLCFSASHLQVLGRPLHTQFVRYFGLGRTVMCLHEDCVYPSAIRMPPVPMCFSYNAQLMWLKQEAAELTQESMEAFDVLELALKQHPYFQNQQGATGSISSSTTEPPAAGTTAIDAVADGSASPLASLAAMVSAVRKDRSSVMDKVADIIQRATPGTPPETDASGVPWDELLTSGIMELNRLRRSLAITCLTWAATLQDPSFFAQATHASSTAAAAAAAVATGANGNNGSLGMPGSPVVAQGGSPNGGGGASIFHLSSTAAAHRLGVQDGGIEGGLGVMVPLVTGSVGPLALQDVANLVASSVEGAGGLLEGSQGVIQAVARASADGGEHIARTSSAGGSGVAAGSPRVGSTGAVGPRASVGLSVGSPPRGQGARARVGSYGSAADSGSPEPRGHAGVTGDGAGDGVSDEEEDEEGRHDRFVRWLSNNQQTEGGDEDLSDFYPAQLPDDDESAAARATVPAGASGSGGVMGAIGTMLACVTAPSTPERRRSMVKVPSLGSLASAGLPPVHPGTSTDASDSSQRQAPRVSSPRAILSHQRHGSSGAIGASSIGPAAIAAQHRRTNSEPGSQPSLTPAAGELLRSFEDGWSESLVGDGADEPAAGSAGAVLEVSEVAVVGGSSSTSQTNGPVSRPSALPQIRTTLPAAPAGSRLKPAEGAPLNPATAATAGAGQQGLNAPTPAARVALPGRALLPSGINDTVIPIFDNEPTSIVAHFLSTRSYQQMLNASMKGIFQEARRTQQPLGTTQQQGQQHQAQQSAPQPRTPPAPTVELRATSHSRSSSFDPSAGPPAAAAAGSSSSSLQQQQSQAQYQLLREGSGASSGLGGNGTPNAADHPPESDELDWLLLLLSHEPAHVKGAFGDDSPGMPWLRARFQVTAYFAPQFAELRQRAIMGGEAAFTASLCRCRKWASRGGKSNAYFAKTRDDRFIVKSMSKPEKASFLEFAPAYFEHMAHSMQSGRPTCLAKVCGVFNIAVRGGVGGSSGAAAGAGAGAPAGLFKDGSLDVLVMEHVFYDRQISRIYDLKGSERSRFNADAAANPQDAGEVHLDDNLRRSNLQAPILVSQHQLRSMERALWADTAFLSGLGVMDYSLLVGVDKEHNELVVAVIDFIRQYTWDKQLETWVKSSGILGGNGKEPTIVSPKQYMRRFRTAMSSYFTVVPGALDVEPPLDPDA